MGMEGPHTDRFLRGQIEPVGQYVLELEKVIRDSGIILPKSPSGSDSLMKNIVRWSSIGKDYPDNPYGWPVKE